VLPAGAHLAGAGNGKTAGSRLNTVQSVVSVEKQVRKTGKKDWREKQGKNNK